MVFIKMYFNYLVLSQSSPLGLRVLGVRNFSLLIFGCQVHNKVAVQYISVEGIKRMKEDLRFVSPPFNLLSSTSSSFIHLHTYKFNRPIPSYLASLMTIEIAPPVAHS